MHSIGSVNIRRYSFKLAFGLYNVGTEGQCEVKSNYINWRIGCWWMGVILLLYKTGLWV